MRRILRRGEEMLKEGMIVSERYEIIGRVGSGGMADVYKAKDHKLNRLVAIKVLKVEFCEDKTFIAKFRKEAQAAAGLSHPNIVNVYDVGEDNNVHYIVMELVEGITLKDYITKKGKLSVKEATSIAIQVSLGLEAAHNANIVHRDVKPQNIIISTDGKVKLSDFGIARMASSNTINSNVMVSVHYSSPEQVRGGYSDRKSDIYSLGITMYEMVTGRVPFDGDTSVAIAIKHLQEEMVDPSVYAEDLPYSFEQIIKKCTQKSVDRRYNNLSEVIEDLKRSLVDPNGDFVMLIPLANQAQTISMSQGEVKQVQASNAVTPRYEYDTPEEEEEEEEYYDDEEGGISSKLEKAMTIGGFIIGAIIIGILIYLVGTMAGIFKTRGGDAPDITPMPSIEATQTPGDEQVPVPNIVGRTPEEAESVLNELGLGISKAGEAPSDEYAKGQIMAQSIESGMKVDKHTTIEYTLSTGASEVTVPNVVGWNQGEAENTLVDAGLQANIVREFSDTIEAGKVISVSPDAGTAVNRGDTITLTVSKGRDGELVTMISVRGLEESIAKGALEKLGLVVAIETGTSNAVGEGDVFEQSIAAGTQIELGTSVTLKINRADSVDTQTQTQEPPVPQQDGDDDGTVASSGSWKCNVDLEVPANYQGGSARLELAQEVNGAVVNRIIVDGIYLDGVYPLSTTGADGVDTGTVYLYELVDGDYQKLVQYTVPFTQG